MLVHLDLQVRLAGHFLGEQVADHGVGAAAVVRQVHGEQARVAAHQLRAREDVLPERPHHARIIGGNPQVMRVQVADRDHFLPAVEQQVGNAHVQRRVHDAVIARDDDDDALAGFQAGQQLVAQLFGFAREFRDREPAGQHRARRFLRRAAQLRAHLQHHLGHGALPEIQVHLGIQQRDAVAFVVELLRHDGWNRLHVRARVVVRHRGFQVANGVHAGHEHVVDTRVKQLRHVPVHQLDRVARLTLRAGLRQAHRFFVGRVGEHHVEAELLEECVGHGKQLVQHEGTRDADGLLRRVALRVVALQVHLVDFVEERAVRGNLFRIDAARCVRSARKVPTLEVRRREGFICGYTGLHR